MPFDLFPPSHRSSWKKRSYSNIYILKTRFSFLALFISQHFVTARYFRIFCSPERFTSYFPAQSQVNSGSTFSITVQSRMQIVRSTLGYDPYTYHTPSPRSSKSPSNPGAGPSACLCTQASAHHTFPSNKRRAYRNRQLTVLNQNLSPSPLH